MASTTVSQFKQLFPATAISSKLLVGKVPIKLKLKNDWGSDTLDNLTKLVNIFGVTGRAFHLSKAEDSCIAVIWLCSTTEVKQLKMAILKAATGSLRTMGVLQVFIGEEELVLECSAGIQGFAEFLQRSVKTEIKRWPIKTCDYKTHMTAREFDWPTSFPVLIARCNNSAKPCSVCYHDRPHSVFV